MGVQCISYKQITYMRKKGPPAGKDLPAAFWLCIFCILYIIQDMPGVHRVPPEGRIMPQTAAFSLLWIGEENPENNGKLNIIYCLWND